MKPAARIFLALVFPLTLAAQSVHWDPPGGSLATGETTTLQLVFDGCEPKDTPVPPKVDGLNLSFAGQSSNVSFINGSYSRTVGYSFAALLLKKASVEIPSFEVNTDKGRLQVPAARFEAADAIIAGGQPLESAAHSRLQASPTQVWAGAVFNLAYTIEASRSYYPDFGHGAFDWNPEPLVAEDWSHPEPFEIRIGSDPKTGLNYRTRALAHKPGSYHLNPASQLVNLSVGVTGFGFFQQRQYQQFSVTSDAPTIDVRPLPPAPEGFSGAVGEFSLVAKVVPQRTMVGEPVTWTLELSGTGNWPDIGGLPSREISNDFQVIAPKAKRTPVAKKLFDSKLTEDIVLMPTKPGSYPLRPVSFTYFDPKSGTYKVISTPRAEVVVEAAPAPSQNRAAANAPGGAAQTGQAGVEPSPPPSGLPRDPLPEGPDADLPLAGLAIVVLLLVPCALLLLLWLGLAVRRARRTDPARPRREARIRLAATLAKLRSLPPESGPARGPGRLSPLTLRLLEWQSDAAILWEIPSAAPVSSAVPNAAWSALWSEAERAIFGRDSTLPSDWIVRAQTALAARRAPGFAWSRTFRARNLFPFLLATLAVAAGANTLRGEAPSGVSAISAYRRGDFAAAEAGWRTRLAASPVDWTARYNLSLALAQQNRWDEAAAQASAAFVQQPGDASVRWQFSLACASAGFVPGPLAEFLSPGPLERLARLASPGRWQVVFCAGAWLAGAALALLLLRSYGLLRHRSALAAACAALCIALLIMLAAGAGWSAFGDAADSQIVMVWRNSTLRSVPTEADASQKMAPLAAGNLARADRSFLGWLRLSFSNGQTGWVRKGEVIWLWK